MTPGPNETGPGDRWFLPGNARRLSELDSLRALAALAVLVMHWTFYFGGHYAKPGVVPFTINWGGFGVNLFFVISGFVITMTLERAKRTLDFVRARFFRLYPTFWVCMFISAAVTALCGPRERVVGVVDVIGNLSMVPLWIGVRPVDGVYWTLAVELTFYGWMAVLSAVGLLANPRRRTTVALAWVALSVAVKLGARALAPDIVGSRAFELVKTVALLDWIGLFGAGILLFDASRAGGKLTTGGWLLVFLACISQLVWQSKAAAVVMVVATAAVWIASTVRPWWMRARPLVWVGTVSYPLYLLHQNLGYDALWNAQAIGLSFWIAYPLALAGLLALCGAVHTAVEMPTSQLFKGRRGAAASGA